ncbi:MAG: SDR family oxidoreductase [Bacteroidetes bacterium]|nr:SDR family oxidoreductase [Bacteroidota bacterium]
MISLKNSIVCITGASSGIGEACARAFAREGAALLLSARRKERVDRLAKALQEEFHVRTHTMFLDVRDRTAVDAAINGLPQEWRSIQVLVNNAGLARGLSKVHEGLVQDWEEMIDTNVKGLLYVSRAIIPGMVQRKSGHVINISSIAAHQVYPNGNVYCASKFAVRALTEGLKMDLLGTGVRVCAVSPGLVETEFSLVRFHGDGQRAAKVYESMKPLLGEDIADIVVFCAMRPPHVDISEVIVMPTDQASVHHVHRG